MPRKGHVPKRKVLPDPIYNSPIVTRLMNNIMKEGKKGVAQEILYGAFERVEKVTNRPALDVFNDALANITPQLEVRARRIGGANYQVPVEVRPDRKMTLCLRWLTQYARLRKEKTMEEKLANEIIDAANGVGNAVKKRDDTHRMAESNKAFAHYQW
jgi:small subunit ribosomal protein S7